VAQEVELFEALCHVRHIQESNATCIQHTENSEWRAAEENEQGYIELNTKAAAQNILARVLQLTRVHYEIYRFSIHKVKVFCELK
jgi:serine/threonine protein kinase HipA of HipAB toxin-antitoxin module